ncbi:MAG: copper resistance CopC/CopD family protein [Longimicrobiaceae bacterium]
MTRPAARSASRRPVVLLLAAAAMLGAPSQALAHGHLRHSAPADGAHLSAAPRELRLAFSEAMVPDVSRLELIGPDSTAVELGALALAPDSANVLVVPIRGALAAGEYRVTYQVAGPDGHPVRGHFAFVIAPGASGLAPPRAAVPVGPTAPGQAPPPASHHPAASVEDEEGFGVGSPPYVAVRWLGFAALLVVVGAVAFRWAVLPRVHLAEGADAAVLRGASEAGAARAGLTAASVLALATVLRLIAQSYALHGAEDALDAALVGTMVTRTLWGWAWLLQAGAVVLALLAFRTVLRAVRGGVTAAAAPTRPPEATVVPDAAPELPAGGDRPRAREHSPAAARRGWLLAAAAAVVLALAPALSGHAAAAMLAPLPVLADALHILSAGGWLGSLCVLLVAGIPGAGAAGAGRARGVAALVNAFSPVALASAAVLAATGVFAAAVQLDGVAALWQSVYGRTLLVKLALLTVVFATGAYNWKRVQPALGQEAGVARLRRSAGVELAVGIGVLLVTAVLVATAPPGSM